MATRATWTTFAVAAVDAQASTVCVAACAASLFSTTAIPSAATSYAATFLAAQPSSAPTIGAPRA